MTECMERGARRVGMNSTGWSNCEMDDRDADVALL
jgi:hypothetical protein